MSISEHDSVSVVCPECEGLSKQLISMPNVIFKGDGWTDKNDRIRNQMKTNQQKASKRQLERKVEGPGVRLVPNVEGERVASWSEAKKLAEDKGKVSSTYDAMIHKETVAVK